ncbi:MAG: glycosyltransferase [Oscillospiraceae bacterium]|nr:glycosyltransferase [Oscillospiraceae bacterium]
MKKVLIVSVKAGYGHHSTAKAVIECFEKKGIECCMLDMFEYINHRLNNSVNKGYLLSTKYTPDAFGKVYSKLDKKDEKYEKYSMVSILSNMVSHKLREYTDEYNPDVIITTHSFASMVMSYMRENDKISCKHIIGIVTDFTIHPFWESTSLDYYVTADELLTHQAVKKGIPPHKILPFGIPVRANFSKKIPRDTARRQLGLSDKQTILFIMGSMGFGNIEKSVQSIDKAYGDFQILCVCGNNKKMKKELEKMCGENAFTKEIRIYGFVSNVDVMMDASNVVITKPGGLTTSEVLAKGLPLILMNPIPGQEDRNMEFLVNNGAAMMVTETFPVDEALYSLTESNRRRDILIKCAEYLGKPNAAENLCNFIINEF